MNRRDFIAAALAATALALPASGCAGTKTSVRRRGRLGASTACLAGFSLIEALGTLRDLGFGTVEIIAYTGASHSMGEIPGFDYYEASPSERERVYEATRSFEHVSAHMPFVGVDLLSTDASTREAGLDRVRRALDGLAFLEGRTAVVHPGWPEEGRTYREIWPSMIDTFRALGDYAAERGIVIGLETMQPASVEEYTELIFDVDHPAVGATIDTGHIRGSTDIGLPPDERHTEEGTERFNDVLNRLVEGLGDRVVHVHLTDVQSSDWRDHRTVGSGIIDFRRFFATLDLIGYDGLYVFELEEEDQIAALRTSAARVEGWIVR